MNKSYKLFYLLLLMQLTSCCSYLPLVDQHIMNDFEKKEFRVNEYPYIVKTDSLIISITANGFFPKKCRSKKLDLFFVDINLNVEKNLFKDSITVELNDDSQITSTDGVNTIVGKTSLKNTSDRCYLIIKRNEFYMKQGGLKTNSFYYQFDYSRANSFNYNNQTLTIDFDSMKTFDGNIIETGEIKLSNK